MNTYDYIFYNVAHFIASPIAEKAKAIITNRTTQMIALIKANGIPAIFINVVNSYSNKA